MLGNSGSKYNEISVSYGLQGGISDFFKNILEENKEEFKKIISPKIDKSDFEIISVDYSRDSDNLTFQLHMYDGSICNIKMDFLEVSDFIRKYSLDPEDNLSKLIDFSSSLYILERKIQYLLEKFLSRNPNSITEIGNIYSSYNDLEIITIDYSHDDGSVYFQVSLDGQTPIDLYLDIKDFFSYIPILESLCGKATERIIKEKSKEISGLIKN